METKPEYVYCIKNEAMPNICKCGGTAKSPEKRCKQISNTSLPLECQIAYYIEVTNWKKAEKFIHNKIVELGIKRYKSREWFDCKPEFIKNIFDECKKLYGFVKTYVVEDNKVENVQDKTINIKNNISNKDIVEKYYCKECDYTIYERTAFYHHKKSKQHKTCISKIDINEYNKIKKENEELKIKVNQMEKQLLEKEIELLKSKYNNK